MTAYVEVGSCVKKREVDWVAADFAAALNIQLLEVGPTAAEKFESSVVASEAKPGLHFGPRAVERSCARIGEKEQTIELLTVAVVSELEAFCEVTLDPLDLGQACCFEVPMPVAAGGKAG